MTQRKLSYLWMAVGIAFGVVGLFSLLAGNFTALLTLAVAALIIYSSIFQLGGWNEVKQDARLFLLARGLIKQKPAKKKRPGTGPFRVIK